MNGHLINHSRMRGFLLPAAIFLLVILAALGAYALNISTVQQTTSTQDVQGARAYQAARTGLEWGVYQIMATSPDSTTLPACPSSPSLITVDGFSVSITCSAFGNYFEQATDHTIAVYQLTATASMGTAGTINYIERQLQLQLSKCRGTDSVTPYQCS